ncbi:hypothetical protein L9F63_009445, partial [Diploptera punctata]
RFCVFCDLNSSNLSIVCRHLKSTFLEPRFSYSRENIQLFVCETRTKDSQHLVYALFCVPPEPIIYCCIIRH